MKYFGLTSVQDLEALERNKPIVEILGDIECLELLLVDRLQVILHMEQDQREDFLGKYSGLNLTLSEALGILLSGETRDKLTSYKIMLEVEEDELFASKKQEDELND